MKPRVLITVILIVYLAGFFTHALHLKRTVYGDGIFYYSWLRSAVVDHDLRFVDEYRHFGIHEPDTATGRPANKYSVGPALLWAPGYIAVHTVVRGDGWSLPYQLAVGLTSVLSAVAGLILLFRLLRKSYGNAAAVLTIILTAGATNLLFYGSLDAVNSHALSFFMAVVYLSLLSERRVRWWAVGVCLAVLASIRLQDVVYVLLLVPHWRKISWLPLALGFSIAMVPQLSAWYVINGTLANPYLLGGERFDFLHPHILGVLFAPQNGLILWTPVVAVGLAGLFAHAKKYRAHLTVFAAELLIVASWSTWWQGASVSGRMFVSSLPIIALGLAEVTRALYKRRLLRVVLPMQALSLCLINATMIFFYLFTT